MARRIFILLIITYGSCMKMQETVERTVMVRTSGSDLNPAATGYIYKRGTDGEAVVTKLGESEVMEQLSKLYEPKVYTPAVPSTGTFPKDRNPALKAEEKVIPVKENQEDVDGIADEDYKKIVDEYTSDFDNYLKGLGSFKEYNNKDFNYDNYEPRAYKHNDYDTKKFESYYLAREEKPYYEKDDSKHEYHGYKLPQTVAFRYKNDEKDKNSDDVHADKHGFYRVADSNDHTGHSGESHGEEKESVEHASEDDTTNSHGFGPKSGLGSSKGYGYKVNH